MRRWDPVAVAVVILLAGCGSATGPAPPETPTVTPAPVPTPPTGTSTPAATPSPSVTSTPAASPERDSALPPGMTRSGIVNLSALVRGHRSALAGRSYRVISTVNRSTPAGWERSHRVVRVDGDRVHLVERTRANGTDASTLIEYTDGQAGYVRCERAGGVGPCRTGPPSAVDGDAAGTVLALLSGSESRLVGTESRVAGAGRDGETLRHRVVVTGTPAAIGSPYGVVEVRNYSATAFVAPSGLVTGLEASYEVLAGGHRTRVSVRLRFTDFGTVRVTPPPWYDPDEADASATPDPHLG